MLVNYDELGNMMCRDACRAFADRFGLPMISVVMLIEHRKRTERHLPPWRSCRGPEFQTKKGISSDLMCYYVCSEHLVVFKSIFLRFYCELSRLRSETR